MATLVASSSADPVWRALPSAPRPPSSSFDDVWFIDAQMGWTGWGSHVYRTVDGGATWRAFDAPMGHPRCIAFATPAVGWIGSVVDSTALWATIDSGTTWRPVDLPHPRPRGICGLSVVNPSVVYGCGAWYGTPTVVKSVDAGATWTTIDLSPEATGLVDCHFFSPDSGFVVGRRGGGWLADWYPLVLFTADGGSTWETRYTGTERTSWCWKISFPSRRVGFVSVESHEPDTPTQVLKTEDGGRTWRSLYLSMAYEILMQGVGFTTEQLGWVGGPDGTRVTADGGASWTRVTWGEDVNRIRVLSPTLAYAAGRTIYKYSEPVEVRPQSFTAVKRRWR